MFDKYAIDANIANDSHSITNLLINSPVVLEDDPLHVVGYLDNIEHRANELYFGNVNLINDVDNKSFNKIKVTDTELVYNGTNKRPITVTGFITSIKKVYDEN